MNAPVIFDSERNAYFSGNSEYRRVSKILNMLKEPFDKEGVSLMMARSRARDGVTVKQAQEKILKEWDDIRDSSIDHGNNLHGICEEFFKFGKVVNGYEKMIGTLQELIADYRHAESEKVIYYHKARIAGTTDLCCHRQSGKKSLVDYFDFKTNERNGIKFDSAKRKDNKPVHYNRMLLPPVAHLEDCNYNTYSLQLSLYAYMDEMENGLRPGKLGILFLRKNQTIRYFPVPYMRYEAEAIINHITGIKDLPQ